MDAEAEQLKQDGSRPIARVEDVRVDHKRLQEWVDNLLRSLGVSASSAAATAESLVDADLHGIGTHGVIRVPIYVKRILLGLINKTPKASFVSVGSSSQRLDGDNGLGQWVGMHAIDRACDLAESGGIGMVLATQSNHFGTCAWFARRATARGSSAIIFSQAESMVVPFGGTKRFFGTNPFSMSVPRPGHDPIVLDMATSAVPFGKIEAAKITGQSIPDDWAVDAHGKSTTDPHLVHALKPMAGPKGSGLAMLVDVLSGALAGEACGPRIRRMYDDFEKEHRLVHTVIAIKTGAFTSGRMPGQIIEEMVTDMRDQRPADGFNEVLLPGEVEVRAAVANREKGVPLSVGLHAVLMRLGAEHRIGFPS